MTPLKTPTRSTFNDSLPSTTEDKEVEPVFDEKMEEVETVSFAEQETSDRLDQLLMEEELSDEHIMTLALSAKQDGVREGETEKNGMAESNENHLDKKRCVLGREEKERNIYNTEREREMHIYEYNSI